MVKVRHVCWEISLMLYRIPVTVVADQKEEHAADGGAIWLTFGNHAGYSGQFI